MFVFKENVAINLDNISEIKRHHIKKDNSYCLEFCVVPELENTDSGIYIMYKEKELCDKHFNKILYAIKDGLTLCCLD